MNPARALCPYCHRWMNFNIESNTPYCENCGHSALHCYCEKCKQLEFNFDEVEKHLTSTNSPENHKESDFILFIVEKLKAQLEEEPFSLKEIMYQPTIFHSTGITEHYLIDPLVERRLIIPDAKTYYNGLNILDGKLKIDYNRARFFWNIKQMRKPTSKHVYKIEALFVVDQWCQFIKQYGFFSKLQIIETTQWYEALTLIYNVYYRQYTESEWYTLTYMALSEIERTIIVGQSKKPQEELLDVLKTLFDHYTKGYNLSHMNHLVIPPKTQAFREWKTL